MSHSGSTSLIVSSSYFLQIKSGSWPILILVANSSRAWWHGVLTMRDEISSTAFRKSFIS
jgi:hypothetical protein